VATVILKMVGGLGLVIAVEAFLFAKAALDSEHAEFVALGNKLIAQAQYAGWLVSLRH
jgi:hypothetical protein